jgi:hypothetical protein
MSHPLISALDAGLSVIPLSSTKRPLVGWRPYQTERATRDLVDKWMSRFGSPFGGVVTGLLSGVVVVDYDDTDVMPSDDTLIVRTPHGFHVYYRHPGDGKHVVTRSGWRERVDVRGDGGMVVAPGSPGYTVVRGAWSCLSECPMELVREGDWVSRGQTRRPRSSHEASAFPAMRITLPV